MNQSGSKKPVDCGDSEIFHDESIDEELEAKHIYIILQKDVRVSRNFRAEWFMKHLNSVVTVPRISSIVSSYILFLGHAIHLF